MKNKTTNKAKAAAKTTEPVKRRYVSLNFDELAALEQLGFRERWAYIAFKKLANFKNGMVGVFGKQRLTYGALAEALRPPPGKQGRGEGGIDDTQAADFMGRMEEAGLLIRHPNRADNGGLRFELPMSPINRKAAPTAGVLPGPSLVFSPADPAPESPKKPAPTRAAEALASPPSVMKFKELNINTEGLAPLQEPAPRRASGAPPLLEDPNADPGPGPVCAAPPASPGTSRPLTAAEIRGELGESWAWDQEACEAGEAWQLYESWADEGLTRDDLQDAMTGAEERNPSGVLLTPSDLHATWQRVAGPDGSRPAA